MLLLNLYKKPNEVFSGVVLGANGFDVTHRKEEENSIAELEFEG